PGCAACGRSAGPSASRGEPVTVTFLSCSSGDGLAARPRAASSRPEDGDLVESTIQALRGPSAADRRLAGTLGGETSADAGHGGGGGLRRQELAPSTDGDSEDAPSDAHRGAADDPAADSSGREASVPPGRAADRQASLPPDEV